MIRAQSEIEAFVPVKGHDKCTLRQLYQLALMNGSFELCQLVFKSLAQSVHTAYLRSCLYVVVASMSTSV